MVGVQTEGTRREWMAQGQRRAYRTGSRGARALERALESHRLDDKWGEQRVHEVKAEGEREEDSADGSDGLVVVGVAGLAPESDLRVLPWPWRLQLPAEGGLAWSVGVDIHA